MIFRIVPTAALAALALNSAAAQDQAPVAAPAEATPAPVEAPAAPTAPRVYAPIDYNIAKDPENVLLLDLSIVAFGRYAVEGGRLVRPDAPRARVELAGGPVSLAFYLVALPIGFFLPTVAVVMFLAIAVYLGVPGRAITRMFRRDDDDHDHRSARPTPDVPT